MTAWKESERRPARPKLRRARKACGWSEADVATKLYNLGVDDGLDEDDLGVDARTVSGWELYGRRPKQHYVALLSRLFQCPPEDLDLPRVVLPYVATGVKPVGVAAMGRSDAASFTAWIESTNTSDDAIEHLDVVALTAARNHVRQPPAAVIKLVLGAHREIQALLQGGRQRLRQSRELFRIDAQLLAHLCLLLGDLHRDEEALTYGAAAILAAYEAGSSPAEAFSAQAQIARWRSRYADAADLAAAGYASSPQSSLRVLLACQEANAAALAGDSTRAHRALARAEAADVAKVTDSAWTCPPARHALYRLAVALHCGDPSEALHQAAIDRAAWTPGQPTPFGTSAHTSMAAAIAHLRFGAVDAASEQLGSVLDLPDEYRLATLIEHMASLEAMLREPRFRDSTEGRRLHDRVAEFMARARQYLAAETR